jgi:hypothetical protein
MLKLALTIFVVLKITYGATGGGAASEIAIYCFGFDGTKAGILRLN